jgi:hypothetical protein
MYPYNLNLLFVNIFFLASFPSVLFKISSKRYTHVHTCVYNIQQIFIMGIFIFRFENTVTAIFNGHTHNDHFHVYYSTDEPTRPISVAINGGSVTPFTNLNSNYKTYSVDSVTYVSMSDKDRIQKFILW